MRRFLPMATFGLPRCCRYRRARPGATLVNLTSAVETVSAFHDQR
jgi:hypothetical protein